MIKTDKINEVQVIPFWGEGKTRKPPFDEHSEITKETYPNIILTGRKKSGKTTTAVFLIFKFITNKTKLVIFSPDFLNDKDNVNAIEKLNETFGDESYINQPKIYKRFDEEIFEKELEEAQKRFLELQNSSKQHKNSFPTTIFFYV